ncbi:MAG: ABC-2 transporter permease [Candidatus Zixiibacteriota bacterium]
MNSFIVRRLIAKDWYLNRIAIILMLGGAVLAGLCAAFLGQTGLSIGLSLTMCVLIALTFYLPLTTVIGERTEKTLPFVMSLPVSPAEYTLSKILANLILYLIPWSVAALCFWFIIRLGESTAVGIPEAYVHIILIGFLVIFMFVLGFAIIFESMGWTIALIVILMFLLGNVATQIVPRIPGAREFMANVAQQSSEYYLTIGVELALICLLVAATFYVQSRKKDFL